MRAGQQHCCRHGRAEMAGTARVIFALPPMRNQGGDSKRVMASSIGRSGAAWRNNALLWQHLGACRQWQRRVLKCNGESGVHVHHLDQYKG